MKVGIQVTCAVCGHIKKPIGRDAPSWLGFCTDDNCVGYRQEPYPGSLWPGEREKESGFIVSADGTKEE